MYAFNDVVHLVADVVALCSQITFSMCSKVCSFFWSLFCSFFIHIESLGVVILNFRQNMCAERARVCACVAWQTRDTTRKKSKGNKMKILHTNDKFEKWEIWCDCRRFGNRWNNISIFHISSFTICYLFSLNFALTHKMVSWMKRKVLIRE